MKKVLSLLLALCLILLLSGCDTENSSFDYSEDTFTSHTTARTTAPKPKKVAWLPSKLTFGMTYEEADDTYAHMPSGCYPSDGGYLASGNSSDSSIASFLGLSSESSDSLIWRYHAFRFNEDKELYEWSITLSFISEDAAATAFTEIAAKYSQKFGYTPVFDTGTSASWKHGDVVGGITLFNAYPNGGSTCEVSFVLHSNKYY